MTASRTATPAHEVNITIELVAALLAEQAPEFAGERLAIAAAGWDNVVVRIGDDRAARLPRRQLGADIAPSELDWLPRVGAGWTFPAPIPVFIGEPGAAYPWRWSVVPWIDGVTALEAPLGPDGAAGLGAALAQVHVPAPAGAPLNPFRSQPLLARAERLDTRLAAIEGSPGWHLDAGSIRAAVAAADPWHGGTWCHLDVHGNNVLSIDGGFAGLIDWGDSGSGDAATDLGQALYLVGSQLFADLAAAYRDGGGAGDADAPRVRAEALNYAVTMASLADEAYAASGWRSLEDLGVATRD